MRQNGTRSKAGKVLGAAAELSNPQFERLLPQLFALRVSRARHVLGDREVQLLQQINRSLPRATQAQLHRLVEKRRAGTLTQKEIRQLQHLTDRMEMWDARRLRCLVELAGLRHTTLDKLMRALGLKTPAYA